MEAKICDRCKKFYKMENERHGEKVSDYMTVGVIPIYNGPSFDRRKFDLCPQCREELEAWIDEKKLPGDYMDEMRKEKCNSCSFYGRPGDAPESAPLDCLYKPTEDDVDDEGFVIQEPPCEREKKNYDR